MDYSETIIFEKGEHTLFFDPVRAILLCRETGSGRNIWVKKVENIFDVTEITEDDLLYFVAFERDYNHGEFHAIEKLNGTTVWNIPGRCFLQKIHMDYLYTIFIDEENRFYLLKINPENGDPLWHHQVDADLSEYHIKKHSIILRYSSGIIERIDPENGQMIIKAEKKYKNTI